MKPTEPDLRYAFWLSPIAEQRYSLMGHNLQFVGHGEMDIFAMRRSWFVDEIEIKLTAADFRADFKKTGHNGLKYGVNQGFPGIVKPKHDLLANGLLLCNYFYFLIPASLVDKVVIPDHAGLVVFNPDDPDRWKNIVEVKKAPRLHTRKAAKGIQHLVALKMTQRYWWYVHQQKHKGQ